MPRPLLSAAFLIVLPFAAPGQQPFREFKGCDAPIRNVVFSPDGKRIAVGGAFKDVRIWDVAGGKETHLLKNDVGWVLSVAFSPDGNSLVTTTTDDGTLRVWDVATGRQRLILERHLKRHVHFVTYSADGRRIASSANGDGTVRVWDAATGAHLLVMQAHNDAVVVTFAPDGKTVASGGADHTIKLWDATARKLIRQFNGHTSSVAGLVFSRDGKRLYSGSHDGTVREWDVESGRELRKVASGCGAARTLALSPDGRSLAVSNEHGSAQVWELATLQQRRYFLTDKGFTWSVAFAPDGKSIASAGDDKVVRLWDVTGGWGDTAKRPPLKDKDLERFWQELGGPNAGRAYTAVWALAAHPGESVPFLAKQLRAERAVPVVLGIRVQETLEKIGGVEARRVLEELAALPRK